MGRFEASYPPEARKQEIEQLIGFAKRGKSAQLISIFGAGRSTVLRLLAFNPSVTQFHLGEESKSYIILYVNRAEVSTSQDVYKLLFFFLKERVKNIPEVSKEVSQLYKQAQEESEPTIYFQLLKNAFEQVAQANLTILILFDRFSEFPNFITEDFFSNLRSLRNAVNGKLSIVFSLHRPIEELSDISLWKHFYEHVVGNMVFLKLSDQKTTYVRIGILEKERGKKIPEPLTSLIFEITGGHGKLTKLSCELILDENKTSILDKSELITFLLENILIRGALYEIWYGLTENERELLRNHKTNDLLTNFSLPFPLFTEFIDKGIVEQLAPKIIRFNQDSNEIFFGNQAIHGLTHYEFQLLSFL